jgi:hypothetical protein
MKNALAGCRPYRAYTLRRLKGSVRNVIRKGTDSLLVGSVSSVARTHHFRSGTTATKRAWNLRLLFAPSSSSSQHGKERETSPTGHGRLPQLPNPQTIPFPSRLTSLYCIHRIVASPAAVEPRTHSFNRCILLCRYPARPSSYISALYTSQQACNPTLPKLINQLDAALFVHGQGCLQRTCMQLHHPSFYFAYSSTLLHDHVAAVHSLQATSIVSVGNIKPFHALSNPPRCVQLVIACQSREI